MLGLIPRLFLGPVGFGLRVRQLLLYVVVGAGLLRPGLVVGQLEDLGDPLADLLVGWPVAQGLMPECLDLLTELLAIVKRTAQPFLKLTNLAAAAGNELVYLPSAVTAQLHLESVFLGGEIGKEIAIFVHGFTKTLYPGACWKVILSATLSRGRRYRGPAHQARGSYGNLAWVY